MKKPLFAALVVLSATMAAFYARARLASEFAPEPAAGVDHDPGPPEASHLATSRMIAEGDRSAGAPAPDFVATADDGTTHRLADLCKDGPAVLVFIKDGCPCSRSADAFLKRVHAAGRGFVPFYGVIDGGVMVAARWAEQVNSAFPILADPDLAIIHAYHAENSAYVAFVAPGGRIEKLWAGYSDPMLRELAGRMAPWVEPGMEPLDVADAPAELYSGCPY